MQMLLVPCRCYSYRRRRGRGIAQPPRGQVDGSACREPQQGTVALAAYGLSRVREGAALGRPFHPTGNLNKGNHRPPLAETTPWGLQWLSVEARCPTTPPPGPVYPCGGTGFPGPHVRPDAKPGPGWVLWFARGGGWLSIVGSGLAQWVAVRSVEFFEGPVLLRVLSTRDARPIQ